MPLPTHQIVRRRKRRKRQRPPSLESRAGTACWGLGRRDCPCTVPPRVGQRRVVAFGGSGRAEGLGFLGSKTRVVTLLAVCLLWASSTSFLHQMGAWGPGRPPGQETLGSQQRTVVAMGPLRSGRGRMEMPCLGRGPWVPFQALLPNLTKVSGVRSAACSPISNLTPHTGLWLAGLSRAAPSTCSSWHPPSGPQASLRRSVCPPSVRRAASYGYPWSRAQGLPGAPQPARAAGVGPLPALHPGRASRSS